jgi:hypothetical protein
MWNGEEENHKINLADWPFVCMKKESGGVEIPNHHS